MSRRSVVGWRYKGHLYTTLGLRLFLINEGRLAHNTRAVDMPILIDDMRHDQPTPIWSDEDDALAVLTDVVQVMQEQRATRRDDGRVTKEVTIVFDLSSRTEEGFNVMLAEVVEHIAANPYATLRTHSEVPK